MEVNQWITFDHESCICEEDVDCGGLKNAALQHQIRLSIYSCELREQDRWIPLAARRKGIRIALGSKSQEDKWEQRILPTVCCHEPNALQFFCP